MVNEDVPGTKARRRIVIGMVVAGTIALILLAIFAWRVAVPAGQQRPQQPPLETQR
ncbi:MAG TPA: hypothetical protein VF649_12775 [Sphingomonas sp.]|jgi:hypothetical protein|uniref:hypothetical protein n=1 Tax=Sphingomonas sp. TaxID=28214 RepID=UPI002ED9EE3A